VAIALKLLGLKYDTIYLDFGKNEQKDPSFTKYNPNGRKCSLNLSQQTVTYRFPGIPAIIDHDNGDFVLWESNAIIKYLAETYDKENKYHFPAGTKESFEIDQWLYFQASGQVSHHPFSIRVSTERAFFRDLTMVNLLISLDTIPYRYLQLLSDIKRR